VTTPNTVTPTDVGELRDAVLDTSGPFTVVGHGTAMTWAARPVPTAARVSTLGLTGIVTHNPGDMTVAVRAGTPLDTVQAELAPHGQRVAFDPARASRSATVGGLFSTADAGPLALSYGTMRDLVIGATVVLADGTVAHSGGHVIKNVAGYDLTKLLHGAYGTLAVVAELVLRLHPVPEATATLALPCTLADLVETAHRVTAHPVEVTALEWAQDEGAAAGGGRLLARLEGTGDSIRGRVARLREAVGGEELADTASVWTEHAASVDARPADGAVLRLGVAPTRLAALLTDLADAAGARAVTASPGTGVATLTLPATAEAVHAAHERVAAVGGTSTLRHRPETTELPAWGPAPSSVALLRAVAASLDPDQRVGRGRLAPWLPLPTSSDRPTGVTA